MNHKYYKSYLCLLYAYYALSFNILFSNQVFAPELFENKVVIITGGASGIGRAIAQAYAAHNACVVCVDCNTQASNALLQHFKDKGYEKYLFVHGDLAKEETCKRAVAETIERFGAIDILINNVGINDKVALDATPNAFKKSLDNNLIHYFTMGHYALPALKKSKGTIINIGSKVALTGQGGTSGYAAAKGAILGLTREWAVELAPYHIRVNAVIPAEVFTEAYKKWIHTFSDPDDKLRKIESVIPFAHRMTTPQEIAQTVLFLSSPLSSHTTGQFLSVDGGYVHLDRACNCLN
ncbi:MAG: SDR family oxidoreductase [Candidatus Dependentiae bacterium]